MNDIHEYLKKMSYIQNLILEFIDNNKIDDASCSTLYQLLNDQKIKQEKNEFKSFLHLISKISNHYQRTSLIFPKIEKILFYCKKEMTYYFSNNEIFNIFKSNKRCVLYLFQEKIIYPNRYIHFFMKKNESKNYFPYLRKEIKWYNHNVEFADEEKKYKNFPDISDQKREFGEDDSKICEIIRNDSLDDFISFVNHSKIDYNAKIKPSIYETNRILLKKGSSLIEYAVFSGSTKIFKYLYSMKAKIDPSIWQYAVHSDNIELIHLIEEIDFSGQNINYNSAYAESIKCFKKEISRYFEDNYNQYINIDFKQILKSYNFEYFTEDFFNAPDKNIFTQLCYYDYITIVEILLKTNNPLCSPKENKYVLRVSTILGNIEIKELLFQRNEYILDTTNLLRDAIMFQNDEIVQYLLKNPNIKINSYFELNVNQKIIEETNLSFAIKLDNPEIVKILLNHKKIDVNTISYSRSTDNNIRIQRPAFYLAVKNQNIEIIKMLLNRKDIRPNKPSIR